MAEAAYIGEISTYFVAPPQSSGRVLADPCDLVDAAVGVHRQAFADHDAAHLAVLPLHPTLNLMVLARPASVTTIMCPRTTWKSAGPSVSGMLCSGTSPA
jgi:hypothetical protein